MGQDHPYETVPDGSIATPRGFKAAGLHCGLKKTERNDLGAVVCDVPAAAAAVYTQNLIQAAPLKVTREGLAKEGRLRAVLVNSGNANACTGEEGEADAREMQSAFAQAIGVPPYQVAVASTGVIGERLNMDAIRSGIAALPAKLTEDAEGSAAFCQAILTTDLVEKSVCVKLDIDGRTVHVAGAAKGSGMIHPNMATMLGFITTDANIGSEALQGLLRQAVDVSFNMITVDGDTSTNDMVVVMASGLAGHNELTPDHPDWGKFAAALTEVCRTLAKAIARDGEGATKLVEVCVTGAAGEEDARVIAKTILGSSLVKAAVFGADANWGRIIAAAGRAGRPINPDTVDISIGSIPVLKQSRPVPFDEEETLAYLRGDTVRINVDLNMGDGQAVGWGCDLTYEYVRINAAYRT